MVKRLINICTLALSFNLSLCAQTEHIVRLGTQIMSLEAVDSYPQKLLEVCENNDTAVIVRISTFNEWEDAETVNKLRPYYFYKLHTGADSPDCGFGVLKNYFFNNGGIIIAEEQPAIHRF